MRIAYITADHGIPVFGDKGASVHIQELVNAFGRLDHQVHVLAARLGERTGTLCGEITKIRVSPFSGPVEVEREEQDRPKRLLKELRYLEAGKAMEKAIEVLHAEWRFDFLYERYSLWSAAGIRAAGRLEVPCLVEVNAPLLQEQRRYRQIYCNSEAAKIEHETFQKADQIIAVSEAVRNYVIGQGADQARTAVLPNGVNLTKFNTSVPPRNLAGLEEKFVVGFVGSLKPWHGLEALMDAFTIVKNSATDCHLLIVGDGPLRSWIEGYIYASDLADSVTVTGWMDHAALPNLIKRFDVAVAPYPALSDFYFSPLKLFEYMAVGAAIVATGIGQISELIANGRTGLLVAPGDTAGLAEGILRFYHNPILRHHIGQAAAEQALAHSWEANATRISELALQLYQAA